jgi:hypothetical protein
MKILHALVGYLTITALPFYPFAFAAPLAGIDYDGYVATTQNYADGDLMNPGHVFDNILETCRTVTTSHSLSDYVNATQTHNDRAALIKRVPGDSDIIKARLVPLPPLAPAVAVVVAIVFIVSLSIDWEESDNPVRGKDYVEFLVEHSDQKSSARNVRRLPKILSAR